jgi:hypothetical protein
MAPDSALKRLHKKVLKALTRSSATNVDMTLFRFLYDTEEQQEQEQAQQKDKSKPPPPPPYSPSSVLRALAPARFATVALGWQKRLARRVIEHPKVGAPGVVNFVVGRTAWFDAEVKGAIAPPPPSSPSPPPPPSSSSTGGGVKQVVCLAAGYEMRAHRLFATVCPAGVKFFEVDLPHASEKKQQLVQKLGLAGGDGTAATTAASTAAVVRYVPCDLSAPTGQLRQKLVDAGFDPLQPAIFTAEGLLYYLTEEAAAALLREVGAMMKEAGGGSRLAMDYLHAAALVGGQARGIGVVGEEEGKKKVKMNKKNKGPFASLPPRLPRAYEVTARSVAAKGEPFRSGVGSTALEAAAWLSDATGGLLALREHVGTRVAADALRIGGGEKKMEGDILEFYSFLTAEVAGPPPPTFKCGGMGGAGGAAMAMVAMATGNGGSGGEGGIGSDVVDVA